MDGDGVTIESEDSLPTLENASPQFINKGFTTVLGTLQLYGWFILLGIVILYVIWDRMKPSFYKWIESLNERKQIERVDPEKAYELQQSIDVARRRMQEKVSADAERFREKQKEMEERKRQEKIDDWENHQQGKGYKPKLAKRPEESPQGKQVLKPKSTKPLRKPDFNPLTGNSSSYTSYRPSRRGGPSQGGG